MRIIDTTNVSQEIIKQQRSDEFICEKSLIAKHLMTSCRRIRIIFTEFLSGEHGIHTCQLYLIR
jgi:hypothetical protein